MLDWQRYMKMVLIFFVILLSANITAAQTVREMLEKIKKDVLYLKQTQCGGTIVGINSWNDVYHNGKYIGNCMAYTGKIFQMVSETSALCITFGQAMAFVELPENFEATYHSNSDDSFNIEGVFKIKGKFNYRTVKGRRMTVLHLKLLRMFTFDEHNYFSQYFDYGAFIDKGVLKQKH